jgi:hypothetical protein
MVFAREIAAAEDDVSTKVLGRSARARIEASRGLFQDAQRLARDAVALSESTDDPNMRGDTLVDLAMVLVAGCDRVGAAAAIDASLQLDRTKGNIAPGASTRRLMAAAIRRD